MDRLQKPLSTWFRVGLLALASGTALADDTAKPTPTTPPSQLTQAWQSQITKLETGSETLQLSLWAHSTKRRQSVTLMSGDRVLETISGDAVDREAYEKLILSQTEIKTSEIVPPRLGIAGARKVADQIEKRLKLLKRPVQRVEVDRPVTYLVTTNADGSVQAFDSETGESLWQVNVGSAEYITIPAGVNDDYVSVINGTILFTLKLENGKLITQQKLRNAATGALPAHGRVFVTSLDGSTIGYLPDRPDPTPWSANNRGFSPAAPIPSYDGRFIIWATQPKYFVVAKVDDENPVLWCRFESKDRVGKTAAPISNGFLICSHNGTIARIDLPSSDNPSIRGNALAWRFGCGELIDQTPLASNGSVFVVTMEHNLVALKAANGEPAWDTRPSGIRRVLGANADFVYVLDQENQIETLRHRDGSLVARQPAPAELGMCNFINDRLYFYNPKGELFCLHESSKIDPEMHSSYVEAPRIHNQDVKSSRSTESGEETEDNSFGDEEAEPNAFEGGSGMEDIDF